MSLGDYKWKQQWVTTTYLLKWLKSRTLTISNADRDVEQQKLSLLVGMQDGPTTLRDNLAVSYKSNHTVTIDSSNCAVSIYPNELKTYVHQNPAQRCL